MKNRQLRFPTIDEKPKAYARRTDPKTSHDAASSIESELPRLESIVLNALKDAPDGMTADELMRYTGIPRWTCAPRLAPLCRKELVMDSGELRKGDSNRNQIVWKVK
jgi:hypothetical protein